MSNNEPISSTLKKNLWQASQLTFAIGKDGKLPPDYTSRVDYKEAGFTGEVFPFLSFDNTTTCDAFKIHAGLLGVAKVGSPATESLVFAFRGTDGGFDWLNNLLAVPVPYPPYGSVHKGFLDAVESIDGRMRDKAAEILKGKELPIHITGHSKGGAMATLMATKVTGLDPHPTVVTFGAPRVGDKAFKTNYRFTHYRYEALLDLVPHLPFSEQEMTLLPRLSSIYEMAQDLVWPLDLLFLFLKSAAYQSVGTYVCIPTAHDKYARQPGHENNSSGESLNSFCAVEQALREGKSGLVFEIHCSDYR